VSVSVSVSVSVFVFVFVFEGGARLAVFRLAWAERGNHGVNQPASLSRPARRVGADCTDLSSGVRDSRKPPTPTLTSLEHEHEHGHGHGHAHASPLAPRRAEP